MCLVLPALACRGYAPREHGGARLALRGLRHREPRAGAGSATTAAPRSRPPARTAARRIGPTRASAPAAATTLGSRRAPAAAPRTARTGRPRRRAPPRHRPVRRPRRLHDPRRGPRPRGRPRAPRAATSTPPPRSSQLHGGTVEKFIGDAVMAVWGTPIAHEDDAERAVRAALELVDAVGAPAARASRRARAS